MSISKFFTRNFVGQSGLHYIQRCERGEKKPANQQHSPQQMYPSELKDINFQIIIAEGHH